MYNYLAGLLVAQKAWAYGRHVGILDFMDFGPVLSSRLSSV